MNQNNNVTTHNDVPSERLLIHVPDSWQRLISLIRHQANPGHFIFIEAPHGAGKSTFSAVLRKKLVLNEELKTSYQKLHPLIGIEQILNAIPVDDDSLSVIILDDVGEVDAQVIEQLIGSNVDTYIVLLAEPDLINRVPKLQNSRFSLPLFNKEDCHKLLTKQQQGFDGAIEIPILESELIYYESKGFPSTVLKLGEALQVRLAKQRSSLKSFDLANKGIVSTAVIALSILVFICYLVFSNNSGDRTGVFETVIENKGTSNQEVQIKDGFLEIEPKEQQISDKQDSLSDDTISGELILGESLPSGSVFSFSEWINQQNPDYFTIQLYSNSSEKNALQFKNDLDLADSYIYQTVVSDKQMYRVIWGVYPNRARAQLAIQSLPVSIIKQKPWLRSFSKIREEL